MRWPVLPLEAWVESEPWCCQGSCLGPQLWSVLMSVSSVLMENKRIGLHRVVSAPQWLQHYDSEELALRLTNYSMHLSRVAQKSINRSSSEQVLKAESGRERPIACHKVACARERDPPCPLSLLTNCKQEQLLPRSPEWES